MLIALLLAGSVWALVACSSTATPQPTEVAPQVTEVVPTATPPPPTPTAIANSTAPPAPTPSATASATAQPTPKVAAPQLSPDLASRLAVEAEALLTVLTQDVSPRASATDQEKAAADYLVADLASLGFQAKLQPFTVENQSSQVVVGPEAKEFRSFPMSLSGLGTASGPLTDVGQAFPEDIPSQGLLRVVALVERGTITFEEKVSRLARAGAVAAIVYNNESGPFGGTLMNQSPIPAVSISRENGLALLEMMGSANVDATVSVVAEASQSRNVVADKPGTAADGGVVVLGGHYDTVADVPGANDNGSGIATMLAIAREVSEVSYPFTLRIIAFGSEELGLEGSRFYVNSLSPEEQKATLAMLNFDALGSGEVVGILGTFDLTTQVLQAAKENGIDAERRFNLGGDFGSDHASFQRVGIPVVFFLADDFSRIHTPEDSLEFVQPELMGNSAALAIALLEILAAP